MWTKWCVYLHPAGSVYGFHLRSASGCWGLRAWLIVSERVAIVSVRSQRATRIPQCMGVCNGIGRRVRSRRGSSRRGAADSIGNKPRRARVGAVSDPAPTAACRVGVSTEIASVGCQQVANPLVLLPARSPIMAREPRRPPATTPERSRIMKAVGRRGTGPERLLRQALRKLGLRFATNSRDLPGSPDIVFRNARLAIFVHGCFWHRHRGCSRTTMPRSNRQYWRLKFAANVRRDRQKLSQLAKIGWRALVVWQCQIEADPAAVASTIESFLCRAHRSAPAPPAHSVGSQ